MLALRTVNHFKTAYFYSQTQISRKIVILYAT